MPDKLALNISDGDTVVLHVVAKAEDLGRVNTEILLPGVPAKSVWGSQVAIDFQNCAEGSGQKLWRTIRKRPEEPCIDQILTTGRAGARVLTRSPLDRTTVFLSVAIIDKETGDVDLSKGLVTIPIRLVSRKWRPSFSAGIAAFPWRGDLRFTLDSSGTEKKIRQTSNGELPYSLATFAHYDRVASMPAALTFGFATKVPVEDVTALMGVSFKLRTLPGSKAGYLTFGTGLTRRAVLAGEFEERDAQGKVGPTSKPVPATTTVASLTEKKRDWTFFVAFSFIFAGGGESEFSKTIPGK